MGSETDIVTSMLNCESLEGYCGIDASIRVIGLAQTLRSSNVEFEIGDIQGRECQNRSELVELDEAHHCVPLPRDRCLRRYARNRGYLS